MKCNLVSKSTITINAPASRVWKALIDPEMIRQYFFGTEAISDSQAGSPVACRGAWEGKPYEDKGVVLAIEPRKITADQLLERVFRVAG